MSTLDLRGSGGTLRLSSNSGGATVSSFLVVGPPGPPGAPGSAPGTPMIGFDTDGVPYFEPTGVTVGGTTVQADTDGVPYFV